MEVLIDMYDEYKYLQMQEERLQQIEDQKQEDYVHPEI